MKKFISLLAALLCVCGMWAVPYNWNGLGVTSADDATEVGGKANGIYLKSGAQEYNTNANMKAGASQKGNWTIQINKGFKNSATERYFMQIALDDAIQAGDTLKVAAFRTKSGSNAACVMGMDFSADSASASTDVQVLFPDNLQVLSSNGTPVDTAFIVPEGAVGAKYIRIYRNSGSTGLYVAHFELVHEAAAPTPVVTYDTWTVAGSLPILNGTTGWAIAETANDMTTEDGVNYTLTVTDKTLEVGTTYEYKFLKGHAWDGNEFPSSNAQLTVDETAVYKIVYNANVSTKEYSAVATKTGEAGAVTHIYSIAGSDQTLFGGSKTWDETNTATDMTKNESDGLYYWQNDSVALAASTIQYKVLVDHGWSTSYGDASTQSGNAELVIPSDSTYKVVVTFNADTKAVSAVATPIYVKHDEPTPGPAPSAAADTLYYESTFTDANELTFSNGYKLSMPSNASKKFSSSSNMTVGTATYKSIKNSNGTEIVMAAPSSKKITSVKFYAVNNGTDAKGYLQYFDGASCEGDTVTSMKDFTNPTIIEKTLATAKDTVKFTFNGKQVLFVAAVQTESGEQPEPTPAVTYDTAHYVAGNFTNWAEMMLALPTTPIQFPADSALQFKQVDVVTTYTDGVETKKDTLWLGASAYENAMTRESNAWKLDGEYNVNLTTDVAGEYRFALVDGLFTVTFPAKPEPEPEPTPAMESLIQFTETASAGALNGKTLGTGFTLTVTDTGSKIAVDANSAMFGTSAADTIRFAYRMKTGGKSSASSCLSLVAPKDGKLTIYARTGSNSAIDRNVVVTNAEGTEIINHICLEADTLAERIDGNKVYLPISADITAGTYAITYPTSSINFYGFKLDTVVSPEPEPEPVAATDIYVMGIASWSATDAYKMTETVTGSEWTYDFGTTELVGKTFKFATADWSTVNLGQDTEGLKEGTIAVKQGSNTNISVASNYSSATNVVVTLKKDAEGNWTVTAAGTFVEGEAAIPDLYLRGINGAWTATDANKFAKAEDSNTWTLTLDVTASDMFKVADANWGSYNFGSDGSTAVVPGTAYTLVNGSNSNLWLQNTPTSGNFTFTVVKDGDNWTLTVTDNSATLLDQIQAQGKITKTILNGKLYIFKNGKIYNAAGVVVK